MLAKQVHEAPTEITHMALKQCAATLLTEGDSGQCSACRTEGRSTARETMPSAAVPFVLHPVRDSHAFQPHPFQNMHTAASQVPTPCLVMPCLALHCIASGSQTRKQVHLLPTCHILHHLSPSQGRAFFSHVMQVSDLHSLNQDVRVREPEPCGRIPQESHHAHAMPWPWIAVFSGVA